MQVMRFDAYDKLFLDKGALNFEVLLPFNFHLPSEDAIDLLFYIDGNYKSLETSGTIRKRRDKSRLYNIIN